jgi:hypothetical protein
MNSQRENNAKTFKLVVYNFQQEMVKVRDGTALYTF